MTSSIRKEINMVSITKKKFNLNAVITKYSILMLIISILMLAVGILFCVTPLGTTSVIIWIAFGILALIGLGGVLGFIFPPKGKNRDVFGLIFGLLLIALFVILLACALTSTAEGDFTLITGEVVHLKGFGCFTAGLVAFFSIFFGVIAIINAILSLFGMGGMDKKEIAWTIVFDVLSVTLGVLMIVFPFAYSWVAGIIAGVYLIIVSIFGVVLCSKAIHKARKAKKAGINPTVEVTEVSVEEDPKIENK